MNKAQYEKANEILMNTLENFKGSTSKGDCEAMVSITDALVKLHACEIRRESVMGTSLKWPVEQVRRRAGFTQDQMAEKLGVNRSTYIRMERKPETFSLERAEKFCEVTKMPMEAISFKKIENRPERRGAEVN